MNIRKREKINNHETLIKDDSNSLKLSKRITDNAKKDINETNELSLLYWVCLFACLFVFFDLAIRFQSSCEFETDFMPKTNSGKDKSIFLKPNFNDTLARQHLQAISRFGMRPAGSIANEVQTPYYIRNYLQNIVNEYSAQNNSNLIVSIDEHVSNLSTFPLVVFGCSHMTSIYDKLRSVVVKIHDKENGLENSAVMINCHYDSFFGGVGASDDLASCVVMMEVLHALLLHQPIRLRSDIILLFNGAEENFLQASHAFVTQHHWAKYVKLVVNLEAAGSGGRQMIFQASPRHPWIVQELGRVLRQPFASIIGQEIFSANLIPSDTDYRIFRDFGHIPGVDLAFIANGYVYHTSYDTEDRIPQTCLRHTGNNILRVIQHLANVDFIDRTDVSSDTIMSSQRVVFFDFLGLVLISYSEFTALLLNIFLLLVSVMIVMYHVLYRPSSYKKQLLISIVNQLLWAFTNFIISLLLGYLIHRFGCKMSWYSIRYNVVGLYVTPLLWYFFLYHSKISNFIFRIPSSIVSAETHRHACLIIISVFTIVLSFYRLLSCYFAGMWLIFCFLNELISNLLKRFNLSGCNANFLHLARDVISYSLPMTYFFYMIYTLYDVFIPILGRAGPVIPDMVVSALTGASFIVPGLILASNVYVTSTSSKKWLTFMLLNFSISYFIFIHSTNFGFPYNQSQIMPRKQRIFINHVNRNIRNSLGQTEISEGGLWILSLDTNNVALLKTYLEKAHKIPMNDVFCELRPYCGYPLLFPFSNIVDKSLWIPQSPHQLTPSASIKVLQKFTDSSGLVNITFQIDGPSHSPIYIMTPEYMGIISWLLGPDPPQPIQMPPDTPKNYKHYFIFYGYGDKPSTPLTFWIIFMPNIVGLNQELRSQTKNQIEIAVAAHYLLAQTDEVKTLLQLMPKWIVPTSMASAYEHIIVDFDEHLSFNQ